MSAEALGREQLPLASVIGPVADSLTTLIVSASSRVEQLARLDALLLARVFATVTKPRVQQVVGAIKGNDGAVGIDVPGKLAGASAKNRAHSFDDWVGIPPKRFARIIRLQVALRRLTEDSDSALAAANRFADPAPSFYSRFETALVDINTPEQALEWGRRFLDELSDIPELAFIELGRYLGDAQTSVAMWIQLKAMREAHFAKLGKPMPPYTGMFE